MIEIGLTFYSRPCNFNTVLQKFDDKLYLVKQENLLTEEVRNNILLPPEEIKEDLNKQDQLKEVVNEAIDFNNKMNEKKQKERQEELKEHEEYNNTYGYCDNMKPLRAGKILKTLNKEVKYEGKLITRKEFIKTLVEQGYTLYIKPKMISSDRKIQGERIVKYKYNVPVIEKDNEFYVITKTEYELGLYLLACNVAV